MADLGSLLGAAGVGGTIGKAIVQLELDTGKYATELKAAEGQTKASTSKLGGAFSSFGAVAKAGLAAAAVGAAAFAVHAVKAASDLGEAVNKSNVIFGKNAKAIEAWAETGAEAFGLSKTQALDAAGGFGAMLQTAGLAVDASADMSQKLVQLAGDMASFNNIDPTEALEKLRSGLAGEAEPLRRFGVFLSEAAVQSEAYASGIAQAGTELTEAQKVQARYNIIFEQTVKQQHDFARTADSLPNQMRTLRAEFENVSAEVGANLLPIMTSLLGVVKNILPLLKTAADNMDLVAVALGAIAAYKAVPALMNAIGVEVAGLGLNAGIAATAVGLLVVGLSDMAQTSTRADAGLKSLVDETIKRFAEETYASDAALIKFAADMTIASDNALTTQSSLDATQLAVAGLRDAFTNGTISQGEFSDALTVLGLKQEDVARIIRETTNNADTFKHTIDDTGRRVRNFANMTTKELEDWVADAEESFASYTTELHTVDGAQLNTAEGFKSTFHHMIFNGRQFASAMREISKEHWINDDFQVWLAEQGPEAMIGFAKLNEDEGKKVQSAWDKNNERFRTANERFEAMAGLLDDLDNNTTTHTVQIKYEYVGFDPSKPGMSKQQR